MDSDSVMGTNNSHDSDNEFVISREFNLVEKDCLKDMSCWTQCQKQ